MRALISQHAERENIKLVFSSAEKVCVTELSGRQREGNERKQKQKCGFMNFYIYKTFFSSITTLMSL